MSRHAQGTGDARTWATLTHEALVDEITANRRSERWVTFASVAAAVVTVLVIVVVAAAR